MQSPDQMKTVKKSELSAQHEKEIIWACDTNANTPEWTLNLGELVKNMAAQLGARVSAVSVVSPKEFKPESTSSGEANVDSHYKKLEVVTAKIPEQNRSGSHVLFQEKTSPRSQSAALLAMAEKTNPLFIAVATKARRGVDRIYVGSFAENLLENSNFPVITIQEKTHIPVQVKTIGFATDFSEGSKQVFEEAIRFAKALSAKLVLVHREISPVMPAPYIGIGIPLEPAISTIMQQTEEEIKNLCRSWISCAKQDGVECTSAIISDTESITGSIIHRLKENQADMLVLSNHHRFLIGSLIWELVAEAPTPVMIFPEKGN